MRTIVKTISYKMSGDLLADHIRPSRNGLFCPRFNPNNIYDLFNGKSAAVNRDEIDNNTYSDFLQTGFKPRYAMNDIFHREDERLKTFESWPLEWLDKKQLAMTGMFYMGDGDKTKCYFCEVEIGRWEREDQPVPEHMRWSPNCPLLRRRTTNNVPINCEALERLLPPASYDICGLNEQIEIRRNAFPEGTIPAVDVPPASPATAASSSSTSSSSGGSNNSGTFYPEFPEYAIETARLRSFNEWPRNMKQKPAQLAEAGFFYTGVGDRVKCFSCGGGLKDWDEGDEPWEQHALWMGKCRYLKLIRGDSYIEAVVNKFKKATTNPNAEEGEGESQVAAIVGSGSGSVVATASSITQTAALSATTSGAKQPAAEQTAQSCVTQQVFTTTVQQQQQQQQEEETQSIASVCNMELKKSGTAAAIPEEKLCKICYANEYNTAFLPCGHVVACAKCASSVTKCPLCRKPFADVMRVYFS